MPGGKEDHCNLLLICDGKTSVGLRDKHKNCCLWKGGPVPPLVAHDI